MHCIIGLGNPGKEYEGTRHNVGRHLVEMLAAARGANSWRHDPYANAQCAEGTIGGVPVMFVLPETFMNRSGTTVRYLIERQQVPLEQIIVLHDEVDLPLGSLRLATGRGHGGHNGIRSIIDETGDAGFARVRIGISPTSFWTGKVARPAGGGALERFVLAPFSKRERAAIDELAPRIADAVGTIVTKGMEAAMNAFN